MRPQDVRDAAAGAAGVAAAAVNVAPLRGGLVAAALSSASVEHALRLVVSDACSTVRLLVSCVCFVPLSSVDLCPCLHGRMR